MAIDVTRALSEALGGLTQAEEHLAGSPAVI